MIEIFGPNYRYQGEILTQPEILYVQDHCYDEENQCYPLKLLLENSACDPKSHLIVFDHVNHEDELQGYQCLCLPIFLAAETEEFRRRNIQTDWTAKTHAFNFMINKPRLHREFLLMLIEHFELHNYKHTLAWKSIVTRNKTLQQQTTNPLYLDIISAGSISIPTTAYVFGPEVALDQGIKNGNFKNAETYQQLLQKTVFEPSCISLITEPAFFERETIHTEKTIMAIYGGTIPIWVGGWRLPDYLKTMGFDVFDDLVDHSYQNMPDAMDRCYFAIERNLDLLRDFDRVKEFIANNHARFEHNVQLLLKNVFFEQCLRQIDIYQGVQKEVLNHIVPNFRNQMFKHYRSIDDYKLLGSIPRGEVY